MNKILNSAPTDMGTDSNAQEHLFDGITAFEAVIEKEKVEAKRLHYLVSNPYYG
ncbi:MAG: hypothetical protein QXQ46_04375 [Thermoplasmatales archaeon]